jgi:hypothetical protein
MSVCSGWIPFQPLFAIATMNSVSTPPYHEFRCHTAGNPATPGVMRGTCPPDSGDPATLIQNNPDATVTYANIKFGPIGRGARFVAPKVLY